LSFKAGVGFVPIFNKDFGLVALAIVVAYVAAYIYHRYGSDVETKKGGASTFAVIANILTIYAVSSQIIFYFDAQGTQSARNYSNMLVSIFWAVYAALLTAIGFTKKLKGARTFGLALFIITGLKIVTDVWSLGQIYRIVSLIVFGVIALGASFAYAKYKDRIKETV
jgi:NADH:ubiquinone oxidoreductase subunit K